MSNDEPKTEQQQKTLESAGSVGAGKPKGSLESNTNSLANASPATRVNGSKDSG